MQRTGRMLVAAAVLAGLAGCASPPMGTTLNDSDPFESTNRRVFALNETVDKHFAKPVAQFYVNHFPAVLRTAVHNFLANLDQPVVFANDVMQGRPKRATQTVARFMINSTAGLGGFVDLTTRMEIPEHTTDFGLTLARWGLASGPYLILPVFGPSDPRDAVGQGVDIGLDPLTWISFRSSAWFMFGRGTLHVIDERAGSLDELDNIERTSVDVYASVRSLYIQHRNSEINGGQVSIENLPNF